jgi:hypothetical protein
MEINDIIDYSDNSVKYSLFSNIFFIGFVVYTWLVHSNFIFTIKTLKIVILFSIIRYIYSHLTEIKKDNGQKYFQINNKVGIFIILMCILINESVFSKIWFAIALIGGYLYLEIMSAESFTTDILTTALVGYSVFSNYNLVDN